jgi:acyl-CoA thioester hydrolase
MIRPKYDKSFFPHWTTLPIRFRDLDPLNHVNNAIFSTYYEEARIEFIQEVNKLASELKNGFSFVLANIEIEFIRPVEYPNDILIGSGIKSLGNSSITSFQAIYTGNEKKLVSVARAHGVWFDLSKQRPARIPDIPDTETYMLPDSLFE